MKRWRLALNNRLVGWAGIIGLGLMPCPDCALPLAVKIWPVAGLVWLLRRFRRQTEDRLDLLLSSDRRERLAHTAPEAEPFPPAAGGAERATALDP